jgi:hypothetical protein
VVNRCQSANVHAAGGPNGCGVDHGIRSGVEVQLSS